MSAALISDDTVLNEEETQFKLGVEEIDKKYYLGTEIYHLNLIVRSSYLESLPID